jgi:NADH-quinone oxidoreductase subunit G
MVEVEINAHKLSVPDGSTIIEAARLAGIYIPHFCYHKKLSIAANCRMCLVDVEKAPKPLPACATPITEGMVIHTESEMARNAQKGVMEFLLINHPLDCPICDQAGECQLQDLSVGYGQSVSRYEEEKRTIPDKDLGPLIATEMTRCIHCTRCVRYTEEIGGAQELGMAHRSEHSEILAFIGKTIDSEISGNVIDLCPVGALTSKPFRYLARTWELSRRRSVAGHDGLGSGLEVHVKNDRVMRVIPFEQESINECWLSDRDRFSYEGLHHEERLSHPMIKQNNVWQQVSWEVALDYVVQSFQGVVRDHGAEAVGILAHPSRTCEELFLLKKLALGLQVQNIDSRLRRSDFRPHGSAVPWLGQSIADVSTAEAFLMIGGFQRKEQPLLAQRVRQAVKKGALISVLDGRKSDWLISLNAQHIISPALWVDCLQEMLAQGKHHPLLKALEGRPPIIMLGNDAQHHPDFTLLWSLAQKIAQQLGGSLAIANEFANEIGAYQLEVRPLGNALHARALMEQPRKAYWLFGCEPEWDMYDGYQALDALKQAQTVCAFTSFASSHMKEYCDVLLPIAPFFETAGTFINMEGRIQSFNGVAKPWQESRPAWRVLRVLGNLFGLSGFDYQDIQDVRHACLPDEATLQTLLSQKWDEIPVQERVWHAGPEDLVRFGQIPLYEMDGVCRRALSLQATRDAQMTGIGMNAATLKNLDVNEGEIIRLKQGHCSISLPVHLDDNLPNYVIDWPNHHKAGVSSALFGRLELFKEV